MEKVGHFSVDLFQQAGVLLKTRGDFSLEELINMAFMGAYEENGGKIHHKCST